MKILAINGSHRKGKNTAVLLGLVLEEAAAGGAQTELVELVDWRIEYCLSCHRCLREPRCSIQDDDMQVLAEKMQGADAVIIGSPVYFGNVTGRLKVFMDRTRWLHMRKNLLEGKLGAALTHAGLRNGGQELTQMILERFLLSHGFRIVEPREPGRPIYNSAILGTLFEGLDGERFRWRKGVLEDALTVAMCRALGRNLLRAGGRDL
ncbi:Multimeric flavodoxin WrbA [Desulfacinum hydrothermale DSM 13146]|uniref:Multimeric flavodoxin WrbA n=1 Tax=Desulfacinum hydrothermale DSM 13146 TaxID=1121390 RepID=A0A1W1XPU4_9BACT|nr:flavodoxin family protein [Desulfacinum hydrothermale]SMC25538.1 Multimeric flavodoxin WrbA [Desulfacinum hydrothermale DSM 13146]